MAMRPVVVSNEELHRYSRQLEAIRTAASALTAGLSDAQFRWRPAPGRWSIAECIEHLNAVGDDFLRYIDALIAEARSLGPVRPAPSRRRRLPWLFIRWVIEPPPRFRVKSRAIYRPAPEPAPMADVLARFRALQERLSARLRAAEGLDLGAVAARQPVAPVTLDLGQWFLLTLAHERRHLWQARQVRDEPRFP
ncbi:MAG TPA: DinB family protein [Longimicrobiales bacterium]|nr:DinB family protein [Longimicrobiales bacterium]